MTGGGHQDLRERLERLARGRYGVDTTITTITPGDGHAGQTFLFDIVARGGPSIPCVLKIAPRGVRRIGVNDLYRQAPLLRALHKEGLPSPDVLFAESGDESLGSAFVIMRRLAGRTYQSWNPHVAWPREAKVAAEVWRLAAQTLPQFHMLDWRTLGLPEAKPDQPLDILNAWRPTYLKSPEPSWIEQAESLEDQLRSTLPHHDVSPVGLVHGDYQPGNILFNEGRVSGVIDWDLARAGPVLLDIGWLMMMSDETPWSTEFGAPNAPNAETLREIYETEMGRRFEAIPWYRALAGFRMGSIACLNVRLHRSGKRVDPLWEVVAKAIPDLFANAARQLSLR